MNHWKVCAALCRPNGPVAGSHHVCVDVERDNADLCTSIYEKSDTRGVISNVKEATGKMARCACHH